MTAPERGGTKARGLLPSRGLPVLALLLAGLALACASPRDGGPPSVGAELPEPGPPGRPLPLVVISVAGLTPDAYLDEPRGALTGSMPTLAALARGGIHAERLEPVAPASAYPVHGSLVTGLPPSRHGVPADQRLGERGVRPARYWHSSHVQGATLWYAAQQAGMGVAALDWPSTLGASIPLLVPDVVPTRRGETWLGLLNESATPQLRQLLVNAAGQGPEADLLLQTGAVGPLRDSLLVTAACAVLGGATPPGLVLMRLRQTEPVLSATGGHGPEVRAAFARVDLEVGRVVRCLEQVERIGASALVVLGDRAFRPVHTAVRPNVALAEAGLLVPGGRGGGVATWKAIARSNGTSAFVYAKDVSSALDARGVLEEQAGRTGSFRIVPAEAMLQLGADPEAWFGLEAEPGYVFLNPSGGPLVHPAPQLAAGGELDPAAVPGFVAWGRGVRSGLRIPSLRQTDVAPTLAQLLGVELPGAEGRQLVGALRLSSPLPAVSVERLVPGGVE